MLNGNKLHGETFSGDHIGTAFAVIHLKLVAASIIDAAYQFSDIQLLIAE